MTEKGGRWPVSLHNKILRQAWRTVGACPKLGQVVTEHKFRQWKQNQKLTIPASLVLTRQGSSLTGLVSPQQLQMRLAAVNYTSAGRVEYDFRDQFICSGNINNRLSPVRDSQLNSEVDELFACEMDWRKTRSYQRLCQRLQDSGAFGHNNVHFSDSAQIDRYFERYVRLADSIDRYGYQPRAQLMLKSREGLGRTWRLEWGEQEVGVAIGPQGEIWRYRGGYHRTAIARNLGLSAMPVMVKLVHSNWLQACLKDSPGLTLKELSSVLVAHLGKGKKYRKC